MSNEELFQNLKQFIAATVTACVSESMANIATKEDLHSEIGALRSEFKTEINDLREELHLAFRVVNEKIDTLDEKVDLIQNAIAETFTATNKIFIATLQNHAQHLRRLEHRTA
ncbi:MAG TPA: hypothetical protein VNX65_03125 [Patescibacteria group bacterium]|jgi:hypothetical protein|nr:hypothetical protein [Patescibacteria group bacterium]